MSLISCSCGNLITTVIGPNPDAFRLVSETKVDSLRETGMTGDDVLSEIFLRGTQVYKCSKCGRLLVGWHADHFTFYSPEPFSGGS